MLSCSGKSQFAQRRAGQDSQPVANKVEHGWNGDTCRLSRGSARERHLPAQITDSPDEQQQKRVSL